jgi:hypothetical protein
MQTNFITELADVFCCIYQSDCDDVLAEAATQIGAVLAYNNLTSQKDWANIVSISGLDVGYGTMSPTEQSRRAQIMGLEDVPAKSDGRLQGAV